MNYFDPFEQMRKMQKRMMGFWGAPGQEFDLGKGSEIHNREPLIDIRDEGKKIKIVAEMPGVNKKDIDLELGENSINISAESKTGMEEKDKEKGIYYSERSVQSFSRTIPLPTEIKSESAEAELKNGILEISLDKKKIEKKNNSKRLEVK